MNRLTTGQAVYYTSSIPNPSGKTYYESARRITSHANGEIMLFPSRDRAKERTVELFPKAFTVTVHTL